MICILLLGVVVIALADVAPPAHQPKIDVPGGSSRGTSFSAGEFYGAAGTKASYPLPDCFTNESGFMCCNADLLDEMHKAYDDLRQRPEWISCNIQAISNAVQKRAEARFGLPFETVTGISDFATKVHFYHNYICKLEREGRILLAYATPKKTGDLQKLGAEGVPGVAGKPGLPSSGKCTSIACGKDEDAAAHTEGGSDVLISGSGGAVDAGGAGATGGNGDAAAAAPAGGAGAGGAGGFGPAAPTGGTGAGGAGAGPAGPQNGANSGVGGFGASGAGAGANTGPQGGQAGGAGASAGVGGAGQFGQVGGAGASAGGSGQSGQAGGAGASAGAGGQGGRLTLPYKITRIIV